MFALDRYYDNLLPLKTERLFQAIEVKEENGRCRYEARTYQLHTQRDRLGDVMGGARLTKYQLVKREEEPSLFKHLSHWLRKLPPPKPQPRVEWRLLWQIDSDPNKGQSHWFPAWSNFVYQGKLVSWGYRRQLQAEAATQKISINEVVWKELFDPIDQEILILLATVQKSLGR